MSYYYSYMIDGPAKCGMGSPQFAGTEISLLGFHNFVCLHNTHVFYAGAIATRNHYGTGAIHYSDFDCSGNEQNLTSCSYSLANSYCSHSSDVGVICRGKVVESCRHAATLVATILCCSTMQRRRCAISW